MTNYAFTPLPPSRNDPRVAAAIGALAGNWRGEMVIDGTGEKVPFTLLRDHSSDAAVAGRFLFFATRDVAPSGAGQARPRTTPSSVRRQGSPPSWEGEMSSRQSSAKRSRLERR